MLAETKTPGVQIDEAALAAEIAADPVLKVVRADREAWHRTKAEKTTAWEEKIVALQAECGPLKGAVIAANAALRAKHMEILQAKRFKKGSRRSLHVLDRRENARLRWLRMRAMNEAIALVRKQLGKELKLSSFI